MDCSVLGLLVGGKDRIECRLRFALSAEDLSVVDANLRGHGIDGCCCIALDCGRKARVSRLDLRVDRLNGSLFVRKDSGCLSLLSRGEAQQSGQMSNHIRGARWTRRFTRTLSERRSGKYEKSENCFLHARVDGISSQRDVKTL